MADRKNVYFTSRTLAQIGDGKSLSGRVAEIVDRYTEFCRAADIANFFTIEEQRMILDGCQNIETSPASVIPSELKRAGKANPLLREKIQNLDALYQIALVEWIEQERGKPAEDTPPEREEEPVRSISAARAALTPFRGAVKTQPSRA